MTAADRPSVTDDARAEAVRIIDSSVPDDVPGYRIRYAEKAADALIERGLLAAGRAETTTWCNCQAIPGSQNYPGPWHEKGGEKHYPCAETTTATDEDATVEQVADALEHWDRGIDWRLAEQENLTRAAYLRGAEQLLGLLATARTRPTETPEWRIEGTWLVEVVGDCTCCVSGPHGHERGCGLEPVVNLATLPGWPADPPAVIH